MRKGMYCAGMEIDEALWYGLVHADNADKSGDSADGKVR